MFMGLFTNTLLCLNFTRLIIKPKLVFKSDLFAK